MTSMSVTVNEYTSRVLGVVKEKFGLRDKGQALDKFAELFGEEFADREINDHTMRKLIRDCDSWERKHKFKKSMTMKELDDLFDNV